MPATELLSKISLAFNNKNWEELLNCLNPKFFGNIDSRELVDFILLAKVSEILTIESTKIPEAVKVTCLKCLGNSCFNGYKYKEYKSSLSEQDKYCNKLYSALTKENSESNYLTSYPYESHFPYNGVAEWACNCIVSYSKYFIDAKEVLDEQLPDDNEQLHTEQQIQEYQLEILRLCVQFLCNLFTFACKDTGFPDDCTVPKCLLASDFKRAIIDLLQSNSIPLVRALCMFVHNALKELPENYFTEVDKKQLCVCLVNPIKENLVCAKDTMWILLREPNLLRNAYEEMPMEDKLYLLEVIYNETCELVYRSSEETGKSLFMRDTIEFLSERFRRKSDLILKTVDTYLDGMEPTEVIILLDILGVLTSENSEEYNFLKNDKSLLINCIYLLKSLHMAGKESSNYFTPVQKLSDIAPSVQGMNKQVSTQNKGKSLENRDDPQSHPAFGFKAGLIRVIGNMSYRNKICQDILREEDGIPLLLDCCNIDARNPLIMQWAILALRNLCEGNLQNQEIIRNSTKIGVVDNAVLREIGVTLHEDDDGKSIGIVPLVRGERK